MYDEINDELCRVCLDTGYVYLYGTDEEESTNLSNKLMSITSVEIIKNDGLPSYICKNCFNQFELICNFQNKIQETDIKLRKMIKEHLQLNQLDSKSFGIEVNSNYDINTKNSHYKIIYVNEKNDCGDEYMTDYKIIKNKEIYIEENLTALPIVFDDEIIEEYIECSENKADYNIESNYAEHQQIYMDADTRTTNINQNTENSIIDNRKISIENKRKSNPKKNRQPQKKLEIHIKNIMCDNCGKTFYSLRNLADHKRVHSGERPFDCKVCGIRFAQSGHLKTHQLLHTGIKQFSCGICSKQFAVNTSLRKHMLIHTGERPHVCSICFKTFIHPYHLTVHFRRHTGEKNYHCDWPSCTLSFVNLTAMKRHRKRHEKKNEDI